MLSHLVVFEDLTRQLKLADAELAETHLIMTLFVTLPESVKNRTNIEARSSYSSDHLVNETGFFLSLSRMSKPINIEVAKDGESLAAKTKVVINGRSNKGVQLNVNG